jgi:Rrf2 family cysteine metabolism transcriptional repressor
MSLTVPTKPRYGLRAMLDVAIHQKEGEPVLLRDIAERQAISERYLEHVVNSLRTAGLLKSVRGPKGGYYLTRPPSQVNVMDIIRATAGSFQLVECVEEQGSCSRSTACATRVFWGRLHEAMREVMEDTTLEDLVKIQSEMGEEAGSMYYI